MALLLRGREKGKLLQVVPTVPSGVSLEISQIRRLLGNFIREKRLEKYPGSVQKGLSHKFLEARPGKQGKLKVTGSQDHGVSNSPFLK